MNIEDPKDKLNKKSFALFALGFRPFFLLAAFSASALLVLWLMQLSGKITLPDYYSSVGWHAHEMLFGFTVAVIAGFLLTAVGNWTGKKMINGGLLLRLSIVFLSARLVPFMPDVPIGLIAFLDLSFIPLVAILIAVPIIHASQWSNIIFVPLLLTMAAANLMVHLSALGLIDGSIVMGNRLMLYLLVLLIVIMGGRVIPFFTEKGISGVTTKKWQLIEVLSPASVIFVVIAEIMLNNSVIVAYLALFAAMIHLVRLAGWYSNKIWTVPLLWILHLAYLWFVIGFMLKSLMIFNLTEIDHSIHAFTVGGIGIMILGMMARVSLGHTGREMKINTGMVLAFVLINLAAVVRVIAPVFLPDLTLQLVQISGWLWIFSFVIFLVIYMPMWVRPRVDGREG